MLATTTQNVSSSSIIQTTGYNNQSSIMMMDGPPVQVMHVPSSVKSSQSKHLINGILPVNLVATSAAASARNSMVNVAPHSSNTS